MRVILQRVSKASVLVNNNIVGNINKGILVLVGFTDTDTSKEIDYLVDKIVNLRIFNDSNGVMNKSLKDVNGSILSVSQFTLYADTSRGRRPSYIKALNGDRAVILYDEFNRKIKEAGINVETGIFGADMQVSLINDGPVSIMIERENKNGEK